MVDKSIGNYFKVQTKTAGAGQRVVMIYDGIVKNLRLSLEHLKESNPDNLEKINNHLQLSARLILELRLALDMENGGELSKNLNNLYEFWMGHLSEANVDKDANKVEEVLTMVSDLRKTWDQAAKEARKMGIGS